MNQARKKHKILFIANRGRFYHFEKYNMKMLCDCGIEVHFAANFKAKSIDAVQDEHVVLHQLDCTREPFSKTNYIAYKELVSLIGEEKFDVIHAHTPVGGVLARLAALKFRHNGLKVIYTAHGFHFYKGGPKKYWEVFYPIEWICSWITDRLITINREDFLRATKHFHAKEISYVPGIGLDLRKFKPTTKNASIREKLGVQPNELMLFSVGELSKRKNHEVVIKALAKIKNPLVKYFICGIGPKKHYLEQLIRANGLKNSVHLLGFRNDISLLCQNTDVYIFPSVQEGLSVALMEAMACELPILCSDIRGNNDLIDNEKGGYRISPYDVDAWVSAIKRMIVKKDQWQKMGTYNRNKIVTSFSREVVQEKMKKIYGEYFPELR